LIWYQPVSEEFRSKQKLNFDGLRRLNKRLLPFVISSKLEEVFRKYVIKDIELGIETGGLLYGLIKEDRAIID